MPPLLIRADASPYIGTGHVMRMIALAQEWRRRGGSARFLCCLCPDGVRERVEEASFPVRIIDAKPGSAGDLQALLHAVGRETDAHLALDNYHFDFDYQCAAKEAATRLLVVDDYGHLDQYCADVLLNQNPSADQLNLSSRAPGATVLAGTKFALLREEFLQAHPLEKPMREGALNVLVTLGGGDLENVTSRVIKTLQSLVRGANLKVTIVIGGSNPHREVLEAEAADSGFNVIQNPIDMPALMSWADIAVSAGGSTCWELAYFGVPSVVIVTAANQAASVECLQQAGVVHSIGLAKNGNMEYFPSALGERLADLLANLERRRTMSSRGRSLVDGCGGARVADAILEKPEKEYR